MKKIYKYELPIGGHTITIDDPIEKVLSIQLQYGGPTMWAMIDFDLPNKSTHIISVGTGWEITAGVDEYIGTVQDEQGFVWHYFSQEIKELDKAPQIGEEVTLIDGLAVLAEAFGKLGVSAEQTIQSFCQTICN